MGNYDRVTGVRVQQYKPENDDPEPDWEQADAEVEELYADTTQGYLSLSLNTEHGMYFIDIPMKASSDWNALVESLPTWD